MSQHEQEKNSKGYDEVSSRKRSWQQSYWNYWFQYHNYFRYHPERGKTIRNIILFMILVFLSGLTFVAVKQLYPEVDMVFRSKCYHPLSNWNGKFLSWSIWRTDLSRRSEAFNIKFGSKYPDIVVIPPVSHQQMQLNNPQFTENLSKKSLSNLKTNKADRSIVVFGSHHKTGTYLAKKVFGRLCSTFQLCCQFHLTRDSLYAVYHTLEEEPVNILGHNQWIWYPYELNLPSRSMVSESHDSSLPSQLQNVKLLTNYESSFLEKVSQEMTPESIQYKFIHFYRHPFAKIISSYFYHRTGEEAWTTRPLQYHALCPKAEQLFTQYSILQSKRIDKKSHAVCIQESLSRDILKEMKRDCNYSSLITIPRTEIFDYCENIHLCEACCRKEHEYSMSQDEFNAIPQIDSRLWKHPDSSLPSSSSPSSSLKPEIRNSYHYQIRQLSEYQFLCQYLGQQIPANESLQQVLLRVPIVEGLLIESALNYYEILRMAKIINYTWYDMNSINIDLDQFTKQFQPTIRQLLLHVQDVIEEEWQMMLPNHSRVPLETLVEDLSFYDIEQSWLYRWSMSNPILNHITNKESSITSNSSPATHSTSSSSSSRATSSTDDAHLRGSNSHHQRSSRRELFSFLSHHPVIRKMYQPILQLMFSAIHSNQKLHNKL